MNARFADQQSDSTTTFHPLPVDSFLGIPSMPEKREIFVYHFSGWKPRVDLLAHFNTATARVYTLDWEVGHDDCSSPSGLRQTDWTQLDTSKRWLFELYL